MRRASIEKARARAHAVARRGSVGAAHLASKLRPAPHIKSPDDVVVSVRHSAPEQAYGEYDEGDAPPMSVRMSDLMSRRSEAPPPPPGTWADEPPPAAWGDEQLPGELPPPPPPPGVAGAAWGEDAPYSCREDIPPPPPMSSRRSYGYA